MWGSWLLWSWFTAGGALGALAGAAWVLAVQHARARWACRVCGMGAYRPTSGEVREGTCKSCHRISEIAT